MNNETSTIENEITDIIDQTSQEAVEEVVEQPEDIEQDEVVEEQEEAVQEVEDVPFPKKAVNALSRRDKKLSKQASEINELRQQIQEMKSASEKASNAVKAPIEDDYASYGEFLQAQTNFQIQEAMGKLKGEKQEKALTPEEAQKQEWTNTRLEHVTSKATELAESIPDYEEVVTTNIDLLDGVSPDLENVFLALDNPNMALYNLAKDGRLEAVMNMPLSLASVELSNAQNKAYTPAKKVTKAPKPIAGSNGSGSANKSLNNMSADELMSWANK